eukprot:scaffold19407_cov69-Phaeocystis_antarctica.AAC.1
MPRYTARAVRCRCVPQCEAWGHPVRGTPERAALRPRYVRRPGPRTYGTAAARCPHGPRPSLLRHDPPVERLDEVVAAGPDVELADGDGRAAVVQRHARRRHTHAHRQA